MYIYYLLFENALQLSFLTLQIKIREKGYESLQNIINIEVCAHASSIYRYVIHSSLPMLLYISLLSSSVSPLNMKSFDTSSAVESGTVAGNNVDDDGGEKRTGTLMTASAHIITAVIGSGVLSLAWAISQLGWVAGTVLLVSFAVVVNYTSRMLADCYRSPDAGTRNNTYMDVVRAYLGITV